VDGVAAGSGDRATRGGHRAGEVPHDDDARAA
jgi:hypothetical protein